MQGLFKADQISRFKEAGHLQVIPEHKTKKF